MKATPRTIALALGWLLTIAVGILIGRQTSSSDTASADAASSGDRAAHRLGSSSGDSASRGGSATGARPEAASSTNRRSGERTIAALNDSLRLTDRLARTRRVLDLADTLSPDEFPAMVEALRNSNLARIRGTEYSLLLNAWVKADPYAAAEYIEGNDESGGSRETVIAAWAAQDPQAAAAWIAGRDDPGGTNNWMVGLLRGVASTDPTLALEYLEKLKPGRTRSSGMKAVLPHVLQNGFEFATGWVAQIGDVDLQRGTARTLARDLTRIDAGQAGEWISTMASVPARRDASEVVSDQWARRDLEGARAWAESLPENTRTEAAEGVARHMARADPERTATWLNSLGTNPDLDGARRIFIWESSSRAPQVALENVYTLSKQSEQEKTYHQVLKGWSSRDSEAVKTWVNYNAEALPPSVVKRYTPKPKKR
jgi:hypothetical protein